MKLFGKTLGQDVPIIAEIGVNHEGDVAAAERMIRMAAEAGADAAKLQTYTPDRYISASDPERLARVTRFCLDAAAHRRLAGAASAYGITLFSTAVSEDVLPLLDELFPVIKIASGDLTFEPVIRGALKTGKPVILSTGLGTPKEIDRAVGWAKDEVGSESLRDRLVLMHCVAAYPTPLEQAGLHAIGWLRERYGLHTGYSNHVIGDTACLAAVALGADVIEVHFTDKKTGRSFRDHALSFEPEDLRRLTAVVPELKAGLGSVGRERPPVETGNLAAMRKGVVAARDLDAGTVLSAGDLMFARPAAEIPAEEVGALTGRRLTERHRRGELIRRAALG